MTTRPLIAVPAYPVKAGRIQGWEKPGVAAPTPYVEALQRAGALEAILMPVAIDDADAAAVLERFDGLLLMGGGDLHPEEYGQERRDEIYGVIPHRDRFELALARRALERDMPLLGICRGMQMLNVALGGTLVQHLPDMVGHETHRDTPGWFGEHEVRLEPGSLAAKAAGRDRITVKSHHHQGLDRLGEGLVASGWSITDELVEAVELRDHSYVLGVLWHPEEDRQSHVIESLVEAAR